MCVLCRPPPSSRPQSLVSAPKATQSPCHFIPTQRGFWPPRTIPFPSPPLPPFFTWELGKHGPSSYGDQPVACLFLLQICSCARGAGGSGGGAATTYACPGFKAGRGWLTTTTGWLFLFLSPLWPFLFVFPRVNSDQLEIWLPAIIVGSSGLCVCVCVCVCM